jgi:hypothetical protein
MYGHARKGDGGRAPGGRILDRPFRDKWRDDVRHRPRGGGGGGGGGDDDEGGGGFRPSDRPLTAAEIMDGEDMRQAAATVRCADGAAGRVLAAGRDLSRVLSGTGSFIASGGAGASGAAWAARLVRAVGSRAWSAGVAGTMQGPTLPPQQQASGRGGFGAGIVPFVARDPPRGGAYPQRTTAPEDADEEVVTAGERGGPAPVMMLAGSAAFEARKRGRAAGWGAVMRDALIEPLAAPSAERVASARAPDPQSLPLRRWPTVPQPYNMNQGSLTSSARGGGVGGSSYQSQSLQQQQQQQGSRWGDAPAIQKLSDRFVSHGPGGTAAAPANAAAAPNAAANNPALHHGSAGAPNHYPQHPQQQPRPPHHHPHDALQPARRGIAPAPAVTAAPAAPAAAGAGAAPPGRFVEPWEPGDLLKKRMLSGNSK